VFLHTWRSTLIVLVSIPVSVLSTLALMAVLHFNLNLLTMVALVVSVGILVDDSIVVLENISRHLRIGKLPIDATIDGRTEIGLAAITITLVDVVVYVPMAVMTSGLPAQFLQPFAVVITAATLSSLAVSFTLTPMLARFFLQRPDSSVGTSPLARFGRVWDAGFDRLERGYERLLRWSVPRRWRVIAIGLASFAAGIGLLVFGFIGLDFFPNGDQSELDITLTMPASTMLDATSATAQKIEAELRTVPEVRSLYSVTGQSTGGGQTTRIGGANQAQITALLAPRSDRARSAAEIGEDVRQRFERGYPGAKVRVGMPNAFGFGGYGGAPIRCRCRGAIHRSSINLPRKSSSGLRQCQVQSGSTTATIVCKRNYARGSTGPARLTWVSTRATPAPRSARRWMDSRPIPINSDSLAGRLSRSVF
jgi:hydrophobic/amphiphilic exporter-1 (mainly G- bacteria), HAE1 family